MVPFLLPPQKTAAEPQPLIADDGNSDDDDDVSDVGSLGSPAGISDADSLSPAVSPLPALVSPTDPTESSLLSLHVPLASTSSSSPSTSAGCTISNINSCDDSATVTTLNMLQLRSTNGE